MGNHYARTDEPEKSLAYYKEFARVRPDYVRAWHSCARQAKKLGRRGETISYYLRAIEAAQAKNAGTSTLRVQLAGYLLSVGMTREALAQYEAALARRPRNAAAIEDAIRQIREKFPELETPEP